MQEENVGLSIFPVVIFPFFSPALLKCANNYRVRTKERNEKKMENIEIIYSEFT